MTEEQSLVVWNIVKQAIVESGGAYDEETINFAVRKIIEAVSKETVWQRNQS